MNYTEADVGKRMTSKGEVTIPKAERQTIAAKWNAREAALPAQRANDDREAKIQAEIRKQAVDALIARGVIV